MFGSCIIYLCSQKDPGMVSLCNCLSLQYSVHIVCLQFKYTVYVPPSLKYFELLCSETK